MIVKKFIAPTENEAIIKAKDELGNGAVILNIKTLKQRGIFRIFKKDGVEITAALEEKDFIKTINDKKPEMDKVIKSENEPSQGQKFMDDLDKITKANKDKEEKENNKKASIDLRADEDISLTDPKKIEERLDALGRLMQESANKPNKPSTKVEKKDLVEEKKDFVKNSLVKEEFIKKKEEILNTKVDEDNNNKFFKLIYKKLIDNEVDENYAKDILDEIKASINRESDIDNILSAVYQKIILKLGEPKPVSLSKKPKLVFFIGPTGVGKTTTIAKIASKFKLENYAKVAFITSDTYRIAAVEQLNTYASIIDCPVDVVYGPEELEESLKGFKDYDLVLVDTAGRSHKSEEQMDELKRLLDAAKGFEEDYDLEIFLTLSVTTKYKDLVNIAKKYDDIKNWNVIFTKLDETCSLGNIINVKMLTNASLSYTTSGQNVPNDIEVINEQFIAKQLLGGNS